MQRFTVILFVFQLLVVQASGYMWFGTDVGLTRYDGYRFKNYTVSEGLPGNGVIDLKYDGQGRLWIMTKGKLCYFFEEKFYYHDKPLPEQAENAQITSFLIAQNGHLWFTTKEKLIALDSTLSKVVWTSDSITSIPFNNPKIQFEDSEEVLWVYDDDNYMLKISGEEVVLVSLKFSSSANNFIRAACIDNDIFYANGSNLIQLNQNNASVGKLPKNTGYYLEGIQETVFHLPNKKTIQSDLSFLMKDSKGRIWTAESGGGFVILNMPKDSVPKLSEGIVASDMYEDMSGNLWFATRNQGVYFLDASTYSAASSIRLFLSGNPIKNICSSDDYTFVTTNLSLYRFYEQ